MAGYEGAFRDAGQRQVRYERAVPLTEEERAPGAWRNYLPPGAYGGPQDEGTFSEPGGQGVEAFQGPSMYDFNALGNAGDFFNRFGGGGAAAGTAGAAADPEAQNRLLQAMLDAYKNQLATAERISQTQSPQARLNAFRFARDPVSWTAKMGDVGTMQRAQDIMARGSGFQPQDVQEIAEARTSLTPAERDLVRGMAPTEAWRRILSLRHAAAPKTYT